MSLVRLEFLIKRLSVIIAGLVLCGRLNARTDSPPTDSQANTLVITHVTVIDATGSPPMPDYTVIVAGDRINGLGKAGTLAIPPAARVVDATGQFLVPGLWDMHVHSLADKTTREIFFPLYVANGVVGIRDMFADCLGTPPTPDYMTIGEVNQWRRDIAAGKIIGPRIVASSPIVDGPHPIWPGSISVHDATEARETVRLLAGRGVDFIKVYDGIPREAYFALADEAQKQQIPFAGHVPTSVSAFEAARAGQRSIEHLTGIFETCADNITSDATIMNSYNENKAGELFSCFVTNHTWQTPTLTILKLQAYVDPRLYTDSRFKYMPHSLQEQWRKEWGNHATFSAAEAERRRQKWHQQLAVVGAMHQGGVSILAGTDVGNSFLVPGFSLHDELKLLVEAGLSPMEALQSATRNPAAFLGIPGISGAIQEGKRADLLLLNANPLQRISNLQKIEAVVIGGKWLSKQTLQSMLEDVETSARSK